MNLGPLLYHFADNANEDSIEPSYEVVRDIIEKVGFQIEVWCFFFYLILFDFVVPIQ